MVDKSSTEWRLALDEALRVLGGLDGALVLAVHYDPGDQSRPGEASITLRAYHNESPPDLAWKVVRFTARGAPMVSWVESRWASNSVLNWPVTIFEHDSLSFVDFDPLHAKEVASGVALSRYFIAGTEIFVEGL